MGIRPNEYLVLASLIQGETNINNLPTVTPVIDMDEKELSMVSVLTDFIQSNQGMDGLGRDLLSRVFVLANAFDRQDSHDMEYYVMNTRIQVEELYGENAQVILQALSALFVPIPETFPLDIWTQPINHNK